MVLPDLDDDGYLPIGAHDVTMEEIEEQFGRFQRTDRRIKLFEKLKEFVGELRKSGMVDHVVVDGSFITGEDQPSDIDLVLALKTDHDFSTELRPFQYNVLSKRRVRKRFQFDVLVARVESKEYDEYVGFFQQVKGQPGRSKGVLKVVL